MKRSLSTPNRGGRIEVEEQKEMEDEIREKWDGKERGRERERRWGGFCGLKKPLLTAITSSSSPCLAQKQSHSLF
ncbi:hypothetical protein NC651_036156 [Populus alba x Populus x berolinensis]|nr:hypothetical protein NC651_036156 [Populus alba x Populus x berolinensis]